MTNVHNEPQSVETLRLPGLSCPMPVLRAKKALAKMTPGAVLAVWSTDPHSTPDLSDFCPYPPLIPPFCPPKPSKEKPDWVITATSF